VTLLTPFKRISTLKLAKLPIFGSADQPQLTQLTQLSPGEIVLAHSPIAAPIIPPSDPLPLSPSEVLAKIGSKLREWREYYQLSIDDISARTQIQPRLIQAIEAGCVEMLPEWIYVKGMIKRYADNLGLNGTEISQHILSWEPVAAKSTAVAKQGSGFKLVLQLKPLHVYIGYMLAVCGISAGSSHLLNNALRPTATTIRNQVMQSPRSIVVKPLTVPFPNKIEK
jgi:Helix-turn-helix domain